MIATGEPKSLTTKLVKQAAYTAVPVLMDGDTRVAMAYNPGLLPELRQQDVAIASNLIIDPEGKIQFFSLLDSKHFDAKLIKLKRRLDQLLRAHEAKKPGA